ncbi:aminotransferase-like domain-containing protein [Desulfogranum mediterraneum]|uniref:aminotransferase-like domain-containing protein n=1 Tax=Desulfogranum mediterraneum TaxID=160661 RepID=UPI0004027FFE|nr:PLP-dependent aminotransferase family protein [Desulfogranum mediterraneum]
MIIRKADREAAPLYRQVADSVGAMIDQGSFRTGDRIPSIRSLSRQLKVSINTVKVAYSLLEDQCRIEARPQAGYYVRPRLPALPQEPDLADHAVTPLEITSTGLVTRIMLDSLEPDKVPFGAAIPAAELIPALKLNRLLATVNRQRLQESVNYATGAGSLRLRSQIARRMITAGCTLNPDELIITTGASEAVFLALRSTCRPGDTIAVGTPIYFSFLQMFQELGLRVLEIPSSPSSGLHLDTLGQALERQTVQACLVISNVNNPLGICLSDQKKQKLVQLLEEHDVPLIEDDINGDLSFSDQRPSVAKAWDRNNRVLLCSSFSKTLAPGYRVGWVAPGRYQERLLRLKLTTNIASPSPTQLAVAEFLNSGGYEHHLRSIRRAYRTKVLQMSAAVGHCFPPGTRISRPEGGFTLWVELPARVDTIDLYRRAIKLGISFAPGAVFSTSQNHSNCLRLNAAFWSDEHHWAISRLGELAAA